VFVGFVDLCELRCVRFELFAVLAIGLLETPSSRANARASEVRRMGCSPRPRLISRPQLKREGLAFAIVSSADR
jgi:hypothetical protein